MKKHIIFNDIILITPDIFDDKRGFFSEIYNKKSFEKLGIKRYCCRRHMLSHIELIDDI